MSAHSLGENVYIHFFGSPLLLLITGILPEMTAQSLGGRSSTWYTVGSADNALVDFTHYRTLPYSSGPPPAGASATTGTTAMMGPWKQLHYGTGTLQ